MKKRILIVDDEADLGIMLKRFFELNNYEVSTAVNGMQAIEQAGTQPDLILLNNTYQRYIRTFEQHYSVMGAHRIKDITPQEIEDFLEEEVFHKHLAI